MKFKTNILSAIATIAIAMAALVAPQNANALPAEHYAASSKLASGKWVKVKVQETGIQFLSNSFLRNQGFSDPSKVNVYGFGGRIISEALNSEQVDDLPLLPVVRTSDGILFFGHSNLRWNQNNVAGFAAKKYLHEFNPYDDNSWYFISDKEIENVANELPAPEFADVAPANREITTFRERLVHERDLVAPSNTGRILLGEDFRSKKTQSFDFDLKGIADGNAIVKVAFGSRISSGSGSLTFTANGNSIPSTSDDRISNITASETFMKLTETTKEISDIRGEKLNFGISFSASGALTLARLDYISIEYERKLEIPKDSRQLYFYGTGAGKYVIEGMTKNTRVWEISDPQNPKEVEVALNGTKGSFDVTDEMYHEFVAFEPSATTKAISTGVKIDNQDIHAMDTPDMLIISPFEYLSQAQRIADLHVEKDGMRVHILTPEAIYNEFSSGSADVSAFRKALKMWHDRGEDNGHKIQYCLIMSRPTYDNRGITEAVKDAGYPRVPIWQSPNGTSEITSYSTDAIIGMLEDTGTYFNISNSPMNVSVGRMPVKSLAEATHVADKMIDYVMTPDFGDWRNRIMIIADDQDNNAHFYQAQSVYSHMHGSPNGSKYRYDRLYLDAYELERTGTGLTYVEPNRILNQAFSDGVMYINYIGHASPRGWGHEGLLTWSNIMDMHNSRFPFIYGATCEFTRWDDDVVSGGERMYLNPHAGVIGFIAASRSVYISDNGVLNNSMHKSFFNIEDYPRGKRIGDIFREGMNGLSKADDNKLRYILMCDPALQLPMPELNVVIDSIDDTDFTSGSPKELPVLQAGAKVKVTGHIADAQGNIVPDFNGLLQPTLFDAERVIETKGNGEQGVSVMYNDHTEKIYTGKTRVIDGKWEALILMPSDVDNNHTNALLTLYAYSENGIEANGSSTDLLVYGYADSMDQDNKGPEIRDFFLNNEAFEDNDIISESAIVYATLRDESGVNIAEGGIGRLMTLTLDSRTVFTDISRYYEPSDTDPYAGSFKYVLTGLTPGYHELELSAWDNANNNTVSTLRFRVEANRRPELYEVFADCSPASTQVTFTLKHDQPATALNVTFEVFDLTGRKVWTTEAIAPAMTNGIANVTWNLKDSAGVRVPRGIYIYRATVSTPEGKASSKSKKLAVTAR